MWGDKTAEPKNPNPQQEALMKPKPSTEQPQRANPVSTVGRSVTIQGSLKSEEDIIIYGTFKGEVELKNNNLTIGKSGRLEANVFAKSIRIEGEVVGDFYANSVAVSKTGAIFGNIVSPRVTLEDGAKFKGSIDMDDKSINKKLGNGEGKLPESKPKLISTNNESKKDIAHSEQ